jgi:hypothetical protein
MTIFEALFYGIRLKYDHLVLFLIFAFIINSNYENISPYTSISNHSN